MDSVVDLETLEPEPSAEPTEQPEELNAEPVVDDSADTCRICSAPADADAPLFHPCKCSGTIKYIHQDCLKTWLEHSRKKKCDVCHYPYSFTKVYKPDMPQSIPMHLFLRKLIVQVFSSIMLVFRAGLVTFVWLIVLPYGTVISWRFFFYMGDHVAWWISSRPRPAAAPPPTLYAPTRLSLLNPSTPSSNITKEELETLIRSLSADVFTGQIIASLVFLSFVAIFLLREYILQNARPGILEDAPAPVPVPGPVPIPQLMPEEANAEEPANENADQSQNPRLIPIPAALERTDSSPAATSSAWLVLPPETDADAGPSKPRNFIRPEENPKPIRRTKSSSDVPLAAYLTVEREPGVPLYKIRPPPPVYGTSNSVPTSGPPPDVPSSESKPQPSMFGTPTHPFEFNFRAPPMAPRISTPPELRDGKRTPLFSENEHPHPDPSSGPDQQTSPRKRPRLPITPSEVGVIEPSPIPSPSPSMTIYRPPEELVLDGTGDIPADAGPSILSPQDYFQAGGSRHVGADDGEVDTTSTQSESAPPLVEVSDSEASEADTEEYKTHFKYPGVDGDVDGESASESDEAEDPERPMIPVVAAPPRHVADSDEDDSDDDEIAVAVGPGGQVEVLAPPAEGAQPNGDANANGDPPGAAAEGEVNFELEDDVEAIQVAIGLRGPLYILFQHAALMVTILNLSIGAGVWLPFTIGKTVALLSLDPKRVAEIANYPLIAVRWFTDPIVDGVMEFLNRKAAQHSETTSQLLKDSSVPTFFSKLSWLGEISYYSPLTKMISFTRSALASQQYARIAERAAGWWERSHVHYVAFAYGDTTEDRLFTTLLGYLVVLFAAGLYLSWTSNGHLKNAARVVALFMIVELFLFPVLCGVIFDASTLGLFENHTVQTRLAFFRQAPITAIFYHWLAGTIYMYHFAVALSTCRTIMRPGAMWFIKDPQDPHFQPVRDILERRTLAQIQKLATSAMMYGFCIGGGFGLTTVLLGAIRLGASGILPLRWNSRRPISYGVPFDLLFLHVVVPAALRHSKPKRFLRAIAREFWKFTSRQFRLSAYMFGGKHPSEEVAAPLPFMTSSGVFAGSYRRVPARDGIALPSRAKRVLIKTDELGEPLTQEGREQRDRQDADCIKAKRLVKDDFTVIYLPPHFQTRMILFALTMFLASVLAMTMLVALPIYIGRQVFSFAVDGQVHDGYSFSLGAFMMWCCFSLAGSINLSVRRREYKIAISFGNDTDSPRHKDHSSALRWSLYIFKIGFRWFTQACWIVFWLGIVIPTLICITVDVYMVFPLRLWLSPDFVPTLDLVQSWALGILYAKILLRVERNLQDQRPFIAYLESIRQAGWYHLDAALITKRVIAPLLFALLALILFPPSVYIAASQLGRLAIGKPLHLVLDDRFIFQYSYASAFLAAAAAAALGSLKTVLASWGQAIRDNEFLLELRLKNLETSKEKEKQNASVQHTSSSVQTE